MKCGRLLRVWEQNHKMVRKTIAIIIILSLQYLSDGQEGLKVNEGKTEAHAEDGYDGIELCCALLLATQLNTVFGLVKTL